MDRVPRRLPGHATLMLSLFCRHGRASTLFWLSVETVTLRERRNGYEYHSLVRPIEALPIGITVCLVADRGFGDRKPYRLLIEDLKCDFVVHFHSSITLTACDGKARHAADRVGKDGRARILRGATVTAFLRVGGG